MLALPFDYAADAIDVDFNTLTGPIPSQIGLLSDSMGEFIYIVIVARFLLSLAFCLPSQDRVLM